MSFLCSECICICLNMQNCSSCFTFLHSHVQCQCTSRTFIWVYRARCTFPLPARRKSTESNFSKSANELDCFFYSLLAVLARGMRQIEAKHTQIIPLKTHDYILRPKELKVRRMYNICGLCL